MNTYGYFSIKNGKAPLNLLVEQHLGLLTPCIFLIFLSFPNCEIMRSKIVTSYVTTRLIWPGLTHSRICFSNLKSVNRL